MTENKRDFGRPTVVEPERIPLETYLRDLESAARQAGFRWSTYGEVGGVVLPVLERGMEIGRSWYVSAGIHGDEPAGTWAILRALREDIFSPDCGWVLFPLLNPTGLAEGRRENGEGKDLNRDYRNSLALESGLHRDRIALADWTFEGALSLHEDWEAEGAYLYEHNPQGRPTPVNALLGSLERICGLDPHNEIDGWPTAARGLIHPSGEPMEREFWPEQKYLLSERAAMSYTVETPSTLPLETRVLAHLACLRDCGNPDRYSVV